MEKERMMNKKYIPAFGNWDYCNDLPITQYFESAMQAGLVRGGHLFDEDDSHLFKLPPKPAAPALHRRQQSSEEKQGKQGQEARKQGKACYDETSQATAAAAAASGRRVRAPKAVDEDLYKIPPELLYKMKPKRKRLLRSLCSGCMGLNCVA